MARGIEKRKYKKIRKEFKHEIEEELKKNRALGMAILNTYILNKHKEHIYELLDLLETKYKYTCNDYKKNEISKELLSVKDGLYETLFGSGYKDIARKYYSTLPENIAFGEIFVMVIDCIIGEL